MEDPKVTVYPHGMETFPEGPPQVRIVDRGCELVLTFAPGDVSGEGNITELRLVPGTEQLEPRVLRRFAPQAELYLAAARSAMKWKQEDFRGALEALRQIGRPGRGLSDQFYRLIAESYKALVAEGEKHPVKSLGENHHATISAASRWVKEARRRGLIKEKGKTTSQSSTAKRGEVT